MDEILREVRRVRESYAKQFNYDLQAIHRDLKAAEQAGGRLVVSLPPRRPTVVANGVGATSSKLTEPANG